MLVTVPTDEVTLGGSSTLVVTDPTDPADGSTTLVIDNAGTDAGTKDAAKVAAVTTTPVLGTYGIATENMDDSLHQHSIAEK